MQRKTKLALQVPVVHRFEELQQDEQAEQGEGGKREPLVARQDRLVVSYRSVGVRAAVAMHKTRPPVHSRYTDCPRAPFSLELAGPAVVEERTGCVLVHSGGGVASCGSDVRGKRGAGMVAVGVRNLRPARQLLYFATYVADQPGRPR